MQHLGHTRFSVIGWSEGAKIALVLARIGGSALIRSCVLQGIITYSSKIGTKNMLWSRDVRKWDPKMLDRYITAYDDDEGRVTELWENQIEWIANLEKYFPLGILGVPEEGLTKVEPPTLVLQGDKVSTRWFKKPWFNFFMVILGYLCRTRTG